MKSPIKTLTRVMYWLDNSHYADEFGLIYRRRVVRYRRCNPSLYGGLKEETFEYTGMKVHPLIVMKLFRIRGMHPRFKLTMSGRQIMNVTWYLDVPGC